MALDSVEAFREQRDEALGYLQEQTEIRPSYLIILGTGLGNLTNSMEVQTAVSYDEIPHFPVSTAPGHAGQLLFGELSGKQVVVMQGRFHYYEGYSMQKIAFPPRVLHALGAEILIVSCACGGLNKNFSPGDVMLINDHINLFGDNPLIGPNDDELGPRFPDMSEPYTPPLRDLAEFMALEEGIKMHEGVLASLSGPTMETKAEYRFLRNIGADAVGMSTIPEVITAVHMGMQVLGISAITDECFPDALEPVSIEEVVEAGKLAEPKMTSILLGVLQEL
jgi:purine-nucleoside phosphorylase